jgi:hypothetical protein
MKGQAGKTDLAFFICKKPFLLYFALVWISGKSPGGWIPKQIMAQKNKKNPQKPMTPEMVQIIDFGFQVSGAYQTGGG